MDKKLSMPVSKAKTAYGLLSEIRKLVTQEPKRYDQENTLTRGLAAKEIYEAEMLPSCGTVGCVAGWVIALRSPNRSQGDVLDAATAILGLRGIYDDWGSQAFELFRATAAGDRQGADGVCTVGSIAAHAKRGAEHIARFQNKYAKQLKAKKL